MGLDGAIDITGDQHKAILALLERHLPNTEAWVYGSRVKWTSRPKSDFDLVVFAKPEQQSHVNALREAFGDCDLPFRVDLFVWDDVPRSFRREIEAEHHTLAVKAERPVADGWRATTLGEVIALRRGFDLPRKKRKPGPYPVLDSRRPVGTHHRAMVRGPGIVVGRSGSFDGSQFIKSDFWPLNTALWVKDFHTNDPRFCYFLLKSLDLEQLNAGSGVPTLNRNHIDKLPVRVPRVSTQRTIAHILGTLDDRIELNRRLNETLEAMVRALFKSWFVDFDPVRAKVEGRDTGLPDHLSDLFPDRLVDSEMGEIPEGWEVGFLGDLARTRPRGIDPGRVAADTPYIGLQHMPSRSVALTDWGETGSVSSGKSAFEVGDILFGTLRPHLRKVGIAPVDGLCSTDIAVLNVRIPKWSAFVLACVSSSAFVAHTRQTSTGAYLPRTSWPAMSTYELCRPTDPVASQFQQVVSPMLQRIVGNVHESRTLAALRNTLLPRLISGKLRLAEATQIIGSTA